LSSEIVRKRASQNEEGIYPTFKPANE